MTPILLKNFKIFGARSFNDFYEGSILIENGEIKEIFYKNDSIGLLEDTLEVFDGEGRILMPGFINCHTHIYSIFSRGLTVSPFKPKTFRNLLEQLWWRLDQALVAEDIFYSGLVSSIEMIKNGITTFVDHNSSPRFILGSTQRLIDSTVLTAGLRGLFSYETTDRNGFELRKEAIIENLSTFQAKLEFPEKIGALFGLHASFTLDEGTLIEIGRKGLPVHIHVAEGAEDGIAHKRKFSKTAVERLAANSIITPNSLLSHCLKIEKSDLKIIRDSKAYVVFNPQSNLNNVAGLISYKNFKSNDIPVCLGNDGYGSDFLKEMRTLYLTQKYIGGKPTSFDFKDLFDIAFKNNRDFAQKHLSSKIGAIEKGFKADLISYKYNNPTPINRENFFGHFFFGIMDNCRPAEVMVDGKFLMKESIISLPEKEIYTKAQEVSERMWNRF